MQLCFLRVGITIAREAENKKKKKLASESAPKVNIPSD